MDQNKKLEIFKAQTANCRELKGTCKHLKRNIHLGLIKGDTQSVNSHTKLFALTYCAWTEALFSKLIHTPYGFDISEIDQIKTARQGKSITEAWKCAVTLAVRRVDGGNAGHLANVKRTLNKLIDEYVESPSQIRNKIAHGQVKIALNKDNTDLNDSLTAEIDNLDVVKIDRLIMGFQGLADIIEGIIESPEKGAYRDYWALTQRITDNLEKTSKYTLDKKIENLREKNQSVNRSRKGGAKRSL